MLAGLGQRSAQAQTCHPPSDSNEAKLLAFYEAPIMFSPATRPQALAPWSLVVGVEVSPIPNPDPALEQTSLCFRQKQEHTRIAPVLPRPRITLGLPAGFAFEASYLPPVTVDQATPNLGSFALSWTPDSHDPQAQFRWMLRAQGTVGKVQGPITCAKEHLQQNDPTAPCYGTNPSKDSFYPNSIAGEGVVGYNNHSGRVGAYAGAGVNRLLPRFQTGFTDLNGVTDSTRIEVDLTRFAIFGGIGWRAVAQLELSAQVYSVPEDVTTWRFGAAYRFW
jgi:hypothetical protein